MIIDVSRLDNKTKKEITDIVGTKYTFLERIKLKGIGSGRQIIIEASPEINHIIKKTLEINYTNIEIRKKGLIVGLKSYGRTYYWLIPFYQFSIFKSSNYVSIYAGNNKIKLAVNPNLMEFIKKVQSLRSKIQ